MSVVASLAPRIVQSGKLTIGRVLGGIFAAAAILLSQLPDVASAIGPKDQKIPDAPTPLSIRATGQLVSKSGAGTGTVVATKRDGTTGYVAVLTAHHVAAGQPTAMKLGSLIGGAAPWLEFSIAPGFRPFRFVDAEKNPNNLPADVALMLGTVKNLNDGSMALAKFNELSNNLPTVTDPGKGAGNPLLSAAADNLVGFTQLGYGRLADYKGQIFLDDSTTVTGYQATNVSGERLFENNKARESIAAAVVKDPLTEQDKYFYPKVRFTAIGPPNNQGEGLGLGGDSGGPLFTTAPAAAVNIQVTRDGNNIQIPIKYTDSLSAVFVSSQPATITEIIDGLPVKTEYSPETVGNNSSQFALPINQPIYNWIKPVLVNPMLIPEPSTAILAGWCWLLCVAGWRRRRAGGGA